MGGEDSLSEGACGPNGGSFGGGGGGGGGGLLQTRSAAFPMSLGGVQHGQGAGGRGMRRRGRDGGGTGAAEQAGLLAPAPEAHQLQKALGLMEDRLAAAIDPDQLTGEPLGKQLIYYPGGLLVWCLHTASV